MLIQSFFSENRRLVPMEVELTLWPGLPCIQFVGLPDQQIRESALRIKSAIKAQGFQFPKAQQILVNLRPNTMKKSSQGLELAVALAYLIESGQIPVPSEETLKNTFVYGSLTLAGEIRAPLDLPSLGKKMAPGSQLITGLVEDPRSCPTMDYAGLPSLQSLNSNWNFRRPRNFPLFVRPPLDEEFRWTESEAHFLQLAAVGGHHALLAGPSGSGKSTMAKVIHQLLPMPAVEEEILPNENFWRPLARPHHSVTLRGLIGGGADVQVGELTRASGGVLLLDELLEFRSEALESLREPMESGEIHLSRGEVSRTLPTRFQLLATTNLCPCGKWIPGVTRSYCRFTLSRCRSYGSRLSGPLLDRFQILHFVFAQWGSKMETRHVKTSRLVRRIEQATEMRLKRGQRLLNAHIGMEELRAHDQGIIVANLLPESLGSERRRLATLRVARSLADLAGEVRIRPEDLQKALHYTYNNFHSLGRWD